MGQQGDCWCVAMCEIGLAKRHDWTKLQQGSMELNKEYLRNMAIDPMCSQSWPSNIIRGGLQVFGFVQLLQSVLGVGWTLVEDHWGQSLVDGMKWKSEWHPRRAGPGG